MNRFKQLTVSAVCLRVSVCRIRVRLPFSFFQSLFSAENKEHRNCDGLSSMLENEVRACVRVCGSTSTCSCN